jgi:hypothetical protein
MQIRFIISPSEAVQLAAVQQAGYAIKYIRNPSDAVQLAAVRQSRYAVYYIDTPSALLIKTALQTPILINDQYWYKKTVKKLFDGNAILTKKWLRYGEAMRSQL